MSLKFHSFIIGDVRVAISSTLLRILTPPMAFAHR